MPAELHAALTRILPTPVADEIDLASGGWVDTLLELLERVRAELEYEVKTLEGLEAEAAKAQKYPLAERYKKVANTLRKRELLGFLANRNILPKYGFPVDSVDLRTDFGYGKDTGSKLDLNRDLSQAIYEYAPGATLVAGGQLWTSGGIHRLPGRELEEYKYYVCRRCGGFRAGIENVEQACPHCGEVAQSAPRTLTIPEFGFVAEREPTKPGPHPPQRPWSGAVHVLAESPEARTSELTLAGGRIGIKVGPRGRLIATADGPAGMGFWVCEWCGHGSPRMDDPKKPPRHNHLLKNTPCDGFHRLLDLAHRYETDLLILDVKLPGFHGSQNAWLSVLYAIVEAACEVLEIARKELGGSLKPTGADEWEIALFDTVSGGAGHVLQVERNLDKVLTAALSRVASCECGEETSCYGCLRSYENQRHHDDLARGAAQQVLRRLLEQTGIIDLRYQRQETTKAETPNDVPADWADLYHQAAEQERTLLEKLAKAGAARPELDIVSASGIPLRIAWLDRLLAADLGLNPKDRKDLTADGWTVLAPGIKLTEAAAIERPSGSRTADCGPIAVPAPVARPPPGALDAGGHGCRCSRVAGSHLRRLPDTSGRYRRLTSTLRSSTGYRPLK